jgi:hypothetical protein
MKCNETIGKWCKNKHGASKIIDTFETYHSIRGEDGWNPTAGARMAVLQGGGEWIRGGWPSAWCCRCGGRCGAMGHSDGAVDATLVVLEHRRRRIHAADSAGRPRLLPDANPLTGRRNASYSRSPTAAIRRAVDSQYC